MKKKVYQIPEAVVEDLYEEELLQTMSNDKDGPQYGGPSDEFDE